MKYKSKVMTKISPVCGKVFPYNHTSVCCSEECNKKYRKDQGHAYYLENIDHHREQAKAYREAHRETILAQKREWSKNMTPEQRARKNERAKEHAREMRANPESHEHINALKRARRAKMKGDPEYEAKLREERKRYYERIKADPERYAEYSRKRKERKERAALKKSLSLEQNPPTPMTE